MRPAAATPRPWRMRKLVTLALLLAAGCSTALVNEPSLAPRAAESVDPRVPILDPVPTGSVDPALAERLQTLVGTVKAATPQFDAKAAVAARLAAEAGPIASESWITAQQSLSRLVEQYGVTTSAAADIDALAANRLEGQRWIRPADRNAIAAAAAEVASISDAQSTAIDRLTNQMGR